MPVLGLGLHVLVAMFFARHALRSGRAPYWLVILFMVPLLGSVVYFAVVFLPDARLQPGRAGREARAALALTPTAANQVQLARLLLEGGGAAQIAEAVALYDICLQGPFAADAEIGLGAARARLAHGQPREAIGLLATVRAAQPGFHPEQVGLALADAYMQAGRHVEAGDEYQFLVSRFASVEARAGLALWALQNGRRDLAERELAQLTLARRHMNRHTLSQYQGLFQRLDAAVGK
jgi:hypothetical protein